MIPSRPSLSRCGSAAQEKSEWKNLLSKQRPAAVSTARPERLSSAVHIVFEQLALICHLVEGVFVAREERHCAVINGKSTQRATGGQRQMRKQCSLSLRRSASLYWHDWLSGNLTKAQYVNFIFGPDEKNLKNTSWTNHYVGSNRRLIRGVMVCDSGRTHKETKHNEVKETWP